MREVEGSHTRGIDSEKVKGSLRQTSVAILNFDIDVTDELKWMLSKAAQQLQIPLIFVSDVTARNELVQKCLHLKIRHESHNGRAVVATCDAAERPQHAGGVLVHRNRVWTRCVQGYQRSAADGTTFFKW